MVERVGIIGRIGEALGPTFGEQRQQLALKEEQRLSKLRDDTELTSYLQANQIIDNQGFFNVTTNQETGKLEDSGLKILLSPSNRNQFIQVANATDAIGTYKTKSGEYAKGRVESAVENADDGSISLTIRRPDGRLAPKTWFSTEDEDDITVKMTKGEFKDFMTQNYRTIDARVKPLRGEAVSNQPQIDQIGQLTEEIDKDANLTPEEKSEAILELTQLISPQVDKSAIEDTDLGLPKVGKEKVTPGESKDVTPAEGNELTPTERRGLPMATLDTSAPEVAAASTLLETLSPTTILSDDEVQTLSQGLSKGFRNAFIRSYKFGQVSLESNQRKINELESKDNRTAKEEKELSKLKTRRENYLIPQQQKKIDRVKKNIETDTASMERVKEKTATTNQNRITSIQTQLDNPNLNLSEKKREELQTQLNNLQPKVEVTSDLETYTFTELPTSADDNEAFTTWFNTNKAQLEKASKDGDLVQKVKEIITKFDVQSAADIEKIPFGTAEANNIDRFTMANVMAGNTSVDRMGNAPNYAAQLAGNMQIFDAFGTQARAQSKFGMEYRTWLSDQRESLRGLGNEVVESYSNIVEMLFPMDDNKLLKPRDIRTMAPRIREELLKVESNPTTPKFTPDGKGGYVIQGGTKAGRDASKDIAGILFERLVQANGSADVKDWFGDVFTQRGESPDLGQILDRVRYTRDSQGRIDEIFYVDAQGNELDGSIKLSGLIGGFGQEGSYARNLLLAFINEDGRLKQ
mgnify:CR=1 FL=1